MRAHAAILNCERIQGLPLRGLPLLLELGVCHYGHQDGRATRLRLRFGGLFHNGGCRLPFLPFCGPSPEPGHDVASMLAGLVRALSHLRPMDAGVGRAVGRFDLVVGLLIRLRILMHSDDRPIGKTQDPQSFIF